MFSWCGLGVFLFFTFFFFSSSPPHSCSTVEALAKSAYGQSKEAQSFVRALSCCRGDEAGKVECLLRSLFEMGHILPYTTSLRTSISPTTHLTFRWSLEILFGLFRWCLQHDLISQRLSMLHKCLFYIPRNTCSLPPPAPMPPSPPFVRSDVVNHRSTSQEPQLSPSKWFITSELFLSCFCHQKSYLGVQSAIILMKVGRNLNMSFDSCLAFARKTRLFHLHEVGCCSTSLHYFSSSDALSAALSVFHKKWMAAGRPQRNICCNVSGA